MRKMMMICFLSLIPVFGCQTGGGGGGSNPIPWTQDVDRMKTDIKFLAKMSTRIMLANMSVTATDVEQIKLYLLTAKDVLATSPPVFDNARKLVPALPQRYQVYGYGIIDVVERYVEATKLTNDTVIAEIIEAGLEGALEAVQELELS